MTFDEAKLLNIYRQLDQRGREVVIDLAIAQVDLCKRYGNNIMQSEPSQAKVITFKA